MPAPSRTVALESSAAPVVTAGTNSMGVREALVPVTKESYPFYAVPVTTLLELDRWVPHQELLKQGKLLNLTETTTAPKEIIFLSHQWTSFAQPDPGNVQLHTLQRVLKKLMEGKTEVRTNAELEQHYHVKLITTGEVWKERLADTCVWIDYMSMPQPGAAVKGRRMTTTDHRLLGESLDTNDDGEISTAELVAGLKRGVDSIPSYIERCTQLWVLVPACEHADLTGTACDFFSWRSRGCTRFHPRIRSAPERPTSPFPRIWAIRL